MFCPTCGSNNQDEVKFCTRCGTNLGVVSDALTGKLGSQSQIDERLVKLFKDYYRGRNSVIIGGVASAIALFKVVVFALLGVPVRADFLATLAAMLLLYGVIAMIWGVARWNNAASEIKAIERARLQNASFPPGDARAGLLSGEPASIRTGALATDQIASPASITEETTRLLGEHGYEQPLNREKERNG